jgi:hypothetical protein
LFRYDPGIFLIVFVSVPSSLGPLVVKESSTKDEDD